MDSELGQDTRIGKQELLQGGRPGLMHANMED
jgi:hypothetical protein